MFDEENGRYFVSTGDLRSLWPSIKDCFGKDMNVMIERRWPVTVPTTPWPAHYVPDFAPLRMRRNPRRYKTSQDTTVQRTVFERSILSFYTHKIHTVMIIGDPATSCQSMN